MPNPQEDSDQVTKYVPGWAGLTPYCDREGLEMSPRSASELKSRIKVCRPGSSGINSLVSTLHPPLRSLGGQNCSLTTAGKLLESSYKNHVL